jgi:queuosine precursor transporter
MILLALFAYAAAMTSANLLVAHYGPSVTPVCAFFLIGLDLTLRDWLQVKLRPWQMGSMILGAGLLAWLLNPSAQFIAVASAVSFFLSAIVDWLVFSKTTGSWFARSMKSNVAGAAVDSLIFTLIAFGSFMPWIVIGQFTAKVLGGAVWAWVFSLRKTPLAA